MCENDPREQFIPSTAESQARNREIVLELFARISAEGDDSDG